MTILEPLVLADYAAAPRLTVSSAVSLGIALLSAVPRPAPSNVRLAAARLRGAVLELQDAWGRMLPEAEAVRSVVPREADTRCDRAFRATSMRIEAFVLLGPEATPEHERAVATSKRLFPDGLRFLTLPFDEQWAHAQRLLDALTKDEELADALAELVGESIVAELQAAHAAYGVALGITAPREAPKETVSLVEPISAVRSAIIGYALQIIAMQDIAPARLADACKALAPIDELRARQGRRAAGTAARPNDLTTTPPGEPEPDVDDSVTPSTPVPLVEDEAAAVA